jgi:hypothetical protein
LGGGGGAGEEVRTRARALAAAHEISTSIGLSLAGSCCAYKILAISVTASRHLVGGGCRWVGLHRAKAGRVWRRGHAGVRVGAGKRARRAKVRAGLARVGAGRGRAGGGGASGHVIVSRLSFSSIDLAPFLPCTHTRAQREGRWRRRCGPMGCAVGGVAAEEARPMWAAPRGC